MQAPVQKPMTPSYHGRI